MRSVADRLVGVAVLVPEVGLVHVRMLVFGSVRVSVVVVVLDVFMLVAGMRVRVT